MDSTRLIFTTEVDDKEVKLVIEFELGNRRKKFAIERNKVYIYTKHYRIIHEQSTPYWNEPLRILPEGKRTSIAFLNEPKSLEIEYRACKYIKNYQFKILIRGVK